jgi:hypothetical protein
MTARTPEEAAGLLCPLARTFAAQTAEPGCKGPSCAVWRWSTSGRWAEAVLEVAREIGEGVGPKPKASRIVADDPGKFGCSGFCGLGGPL